MGAKQSTEDPNKQGVPSQSPQSTNSVLSKQRQPTNKVQFIVSVIGGTGPMTAYHSSVQVNGDEFSFSDAGISVMSGMASHQNPQMPDNKPQVFDMGFSFQTG